MNNTINKILTIFFQSRFDLTDLNICICLPEYFAHSHGPNDVVHQLHFVNYIVFFEFIRAGA